MEFCLLLNLGELPPVLSSVSCQGLPQAVSPLRHLSRLVLMTGLLDFAERTPGSLSNSSQSRLGFVTCNRKSLNRYVSLTQTGSPGQRDEVGGSQLAPVKSVLCPPLPCIC